jgi:hypothetical protein
MCVNVVNSQSPSSTQRNSLSLFLSLSLSLSLTHTHTLILYNYETLYLLLLIRPTYHYQLPTDIIKNSTVHFEKGKISMHYIYIYITCVCEKSTTIIPTLQLRSKYHSHISNCSIRTTTRSK